MERAVREVHGSLQVTVPREIAKAVGLAKGDKVRFDHDGPRVMFERAAPASHDLVTIGYEGHTLESLVARLKAAGVKQLVDVRELPLSRKKGFSKAPLGEALQSHGIAYRHMGDLGAPKRIRQPYLAGGSRETFRHAYSGHLRTVEETVLALCWIAKRDRTAIMCVERASMDCHRDVLSEHLEAQGFSVNHLM
jgi:uncharacterized protein (DUF488 family)